MNKQTVIEELLIELESQLELAMGASKEAAEYATHEESKADSKWDTQGLEASYLAAGQGAQVLEIGKSIQITRGYLESASTSFSSVQPGALFSIQLNGIEQWFFMSSTGGGVSATIEESVVTVVTGQSPIAQRVVGRSVGESFLLPNGLEGMITHLS